MLISKWLLKSNPYINAGNFIAIASIFMNFSLGKWYIGLLFSIVAILDTYNKLNPTQKAHSAFKWLFIPGISLLTMGGLGITTSAILYLEGAQKSLVYGWLFGSIGNISLAYVTYLDYTNTPKTWLTKINAAVDNLLRTPLLFVNICILFFAQSFYEKVPQTPFSNGLFIAEICFCYASMFMILIFILRGNRINQKYISISGLLCSIPRGSLALLAGNIPVVIAEALFILSYYYTYQEIEESYH